MPIWSATSRSTPKPAACCWNFPNCSARRPPSITPWWCSTRASSAPSNCRTANRPGTTGRSRSTPTTRRSTARCSRTRSRCPKDYDPGQTHAALRLAARPPEQYDRIGIHLQRSRPSGPGNAPVADQGQIQLDLFGRINGAGWHWAGEADVFEAIAAVKKRFKIDDKRVMLRGFSMGGEGAWHIALHHPDRFAAAEIGAGTWSRRAQMPGLAAVSVRRR